MQEKTNYNKGSVSILQIISWGLGIVIPFTLASAAYSGNQISKLSDANTAVVQRVSTVEADSARYKEDIKSINAKLDALLYANGVNPNKLK